MELRSDQELNAVTIGERMPHNAPILLSEYNPQWPLLYQKEETRLRDVLGKEVMLLEHVGSPPDRVMPLRMGSFWNSSMIRDASHRLPPFGSWL